jgi:hypothetical protein
VVSAAPQLFVQPVHAHVVSKISESDFGSYIFNTTNRWTISVTLKFFAHATATPLPVTVHGELMFSLHPSIQSDKQCNLQDSLRFTVTGERTLESTSQ